MLDALPEMRSSGPAREVLYAAGIAEDARARRWGLSRTADPRPGRRSRSGWRAGSACATRASCPWRTEGRQRLRQPAGLRRRSGVQPGAGAVGPMALRRAHDAAHAARRDLAGASGPVRRPRGGGETLARRRISAGMRAADARDDRRRDAPAPVGSSRASSTTRRSAPIVTRTHHVRPRKGAPTPRIAETSAGHRVDTGLQNPGIDAFVEEELPRLAGSGARHRVDRRRHARGVRPADERAAGPARRRRDRGAAVGARRGARAARSSVRTRTESARSSGPWPGCR